MGEELKQTPLHGEHERLEAEMCPFGGYRMPLKYPKGTRFEHLAVRNHAGCFDVSHMGRFFISGPDAERFLRLVLTNDVADLSEGQAQYSLIPNYLGGTVDDVLVYKLSSDGTNYLMVVNAANRSKDFTHFQALTNLVERVTIEDRSSDTALLAVQGPASRGILQPLTDLDLSSLRYYWFGNGSVNGVNTLISRTGYTGEDGFEIMVDSHHAPMIWRLLLEKGVEPAGLGARDTLRLEACMCLYGYELTEKISGLEAGLGRFVNLSRTDMIGYPALREQKDNGVERKLVAFRLLAPGVPRTGQAICWIGERVGKVTSGNRPFTINEGIGMGYVPTSLSSTGTKLQINVRDNLVPAEIVPKPFYKRPKKEAA